VLNWKNSVVLFPKFVAIVVFGVPSVLSRVRLNCSVSPSGSDTLSQVMLNMFLIVSPGVGDVMNPSTRYMHNKLNRNTSKHSM